MCILKCFEYATTCLTSYSLSIHILAALQSVNIGKRISKLFDIKLFRSFIIMKCKIIRTASLGHLYRPSYQKYFQEEKIFINVKSKAMGFSEDMLRYKNHFT